MKIGILTYHHVINDGAVLQAYAVAQCLQGEFPNARVEVINYRPRIIEIRDVRFVLKKNMISVVENVRRYFRFKRFIANNLPLSKDRLITDDYSRALRFLESNNYDLIVVGSDEVWKIEKGRYARPFPSIYWMGEGVTCRKVAFAASANRTIYDELSVEQKKMMKRLLDSFDLLSVRDNHTIDFLKSLGIDDGKKIYKIPDPTFILDHFPDNTMELLKKKWVDFKKPLLCVMLCDPKTSERVCLHFKEKGYVVIGLSFYVPRADVNLCGMLNPFEWAEAIKHFDFCITDRFHGAIYCLKNMVPFVCLEKTAGYKDCKSKILSLLKDFDMTNQYLPYYNNFNLDELENKVNGSKALFYNSDIDTKLRAQKELIISFAAKIKAD